MREEIVWNAGMHSHPECLNKLPTNAAEEQKNENLWPATTLRETDTEPTSLCGTHTCCDTTEGCGSFV